jgi:hypothetical protein
MLRRRPGWLLTGASLALQVVALANYFARVEPPVGHGRELDATDVSARRNVRTVEFTTSTAG